MKKMKKKYLPLTGKKQREHTTPQLSVADSPNHTCKQPAVSVSTGETVFYETILTVHKKTCGIQQLASPKAQEPLL